MEEGVARANAALAEITAGALDSVTQTGQMRKWLDGQGVEAPSVAKAAVREMLESDLSPEVRQVLELRAEAGRSSTAKLDRMLDMMCNDDFVRGLTMFHGAATGREAGKGIQPHNFPRPDIDDVESFIPDVLAGRYDEIAAKGGKVVRPAGPMKHGGGVIAFVEDPDGYKIELIERS